MIESRRGNIRQAMWLANANALVWAIGNGLVSTLLVTYLALELGAKGIAIKTRLDFALGEADRETTIL